MEFVYDALGRRVETIEFVDAATGAVMDGENGNPAPRRTRHVYFGLEVIQEYSCGAGWPCETSVPLVREFIHGDPERYPEQVAMLTYMHELHGVPPGEPPLPPTPHFVEAYHYLHDSLGSVIGLVDEEGTLVERYTLDATSDNVADRKAGPANIAGRRVKGTTYDPYGKVFIEKWQTDGQGGGQWLASAEPNSGIPYSSVGNPFMWTGHRYDAVVGLYHTLFRTYDPTLGRWLQRDPIEYEAGSLNLYEYVRSQPLVFVDPTGEFPALVIPIAGGVISISALEVAALTFGISISACMSTPECRDLALSKAKDAIDKHVSDWQKGVEILERRLADKLARLPKRLPLAERNKQEACKKMQDNVDKSCKLYGKRSCSMAMNCAELGANRAANRTCVHARAVINALCFEGGDAVHKQQLQNERNALEKCEKYYSQKGCHDFNPNKPCP